MFGGESSPPGSVERERKRERERGSSQIVIHRSADSPSGALTCDRQQSSLNGSTSRPSTTPSLRGPLRNGESSDDHFYPPLFIFSAPLFASAFG